MSKRGRGRIDARLLGTRRGARWPLFIARSIIYGYTAMALLYLCSLRLPTQHSLQLSRYCYHLSSLAIATATGVQIRHGHVRPSLSMSLCHRRHTDRRTTCTIVAAGSKYGSTEGGNLSKIEWQICAIQVPT